MENSFTRRALVGGSLATVASCGHTRPRSYLELAVGPTGLPKEVPYTIESARPPLALSLVGTVHSRNPDDPMFTQIEALFRDFSPDLVIHENVAPPTGGAREETIRRSGDIGHIVRLARRHGVPLASGDLPETEEFPRLATDVGAEAALVFLVVQRLLVGLNGDLALAAQAYPEFHRDYLLSNGLPARPGDGTWEGFGAVFKKVQGYPLDSDSWDPELTSPLRRLGRLNAISRRSHAMRDRRLSQVIKLAFRSHRRVQVVFGAWHVMALEPLARSGRLFG